MHGAIGVLLSLVLLSSCFSATTPPNIVIIVADDLGWNDVSFHGSDEFLTPNIDALAYSGVILQDYYTQPICTPARAALLTGRHPIHNGMHHDVIYAPQPWGLPLTERLMPQYLQSLGYVTRGVGKWHLGFFKADYTPTRRGFDSFYGSWLGHQNHFTHMAYGSHPGYDLHRDLNVSWEGFGRYAADLFTEEAETLISTHDESRPLFLFLSHTAPHAPLQAPQDAIEKLKHMPLGKRRTYAAMVTKIDESVGRVTEALRNKNMLSNSIILFLTDNGGASNRFNGNIASNWPLRGGKDTLWEGGVRGVGLIWSPLLQAVPRVHRGLVSVQDWLPTLLSATGLKTEDMSHLDGVNQWEALNNIAAAPYQTTLHNLDPKRKIAALRYGKWKIIIGRTYRGTFDGWSGGLNSTDTYDLESIMKSMVAQSLGETSSSLPERTTILALRSEATISCSSAKKKHRVIRIRPSKTGKKKILKLVEKDNYLIFTTICKPHIAPCLYNIEEDPCELNNVAVAHPDIVDQMLALLMQYHPVKPNNKHIDPRSYPRHWNHTWTTWQDYV